MIDGFECVKGVDVLIEKKDVRAARQILRAVDAMSIACIGQGFPFTIWASLDEIPLRDAYAMHIELLKRIEDDDA